MKKLNLKELSLEYKSLEKFLGSKIAKKLLWWIVKRECRLKTRNTIKRFLEGCKEYIK